MRLTDFLRDRLLLLMLHLSSGAFFAFFLYVTNYPPDYIALLLALWLLILLAWLASEYLRRRRYWTLVRRTLEQTDQKYLCGELLPESFRLEDSLYREIIRSSGRSMLERLRALEDSQKEYQEYIEGWVHEIKAPIMDISLLCEKSGGKDDSETFRRILQQNLKIENYVDMALFYARSEEVYKDYLIKECTLQETAEEVLRRNKRLLIQNHMQASVQCPDTVYTDPKWIAFILSQLVLNAAKYCREEDPRIWISTKGTAQGVLLTVEDNGIGIPEADLPRIFDKGFTGANGRTRGRSTGMGLYLCRKLCQKLGIRIHARSEEKKGSSFVLDFPVSSYLSGKSFKNES